MMMELKFLVISRFFLDWNQSPKSLKFDKDEEDDIEGEDLM
jgi:hypothetical protein